MQNPDRRALPAGCVTHFDEQRQRWYYVHLHTSPPRVTFIHPVDETPPSPKRNPLPTVTPQEQQHANTMPAPIQTLTAQPQQTLYGPRQPKSPVRDHAPPRRQNASPPTNNNQTPFAMLRARHPSEAQSIYSASLPHPVPTPSDTSHSIYTGYLNSQETEFDASDLYSSASPTAAAFNVPASMAPNLQPQRRQPVSLDDSQTFRASPAVHPQRSQSAQATSAAQQRYPHNVLRRKPKASSSFSIFHSKPVQSAPVVPKQRQVPTYTLVAQAPLEVSDKSSTPAFQPLTFLQPPLPSSTSNQNPQLDTKQHGQSHTQGAPQSSLGSTQVSNTSMPGLYDYQFPSSMQPNQLSISRTTNLGPLATTQLPTQSQQQPSLSPLQTSPISSVSQMNHQAMPSNPQLGLSNGLNPTPMATQIPTFMPTQPQLSSGFSTAQYPQQPQLNGLPNGAMAPSMISPPMTVSPPLIPPQPQQNNSFPNVMLAPNGYDQKTFPMFPQNGYVPPMAQMQSGIPGQIPGPMAQPMVNNNNTAAQQQQPSQASQADNKNKQLMKNIGMSLGKAVLKFGTKYTLEQMGVDDTVAGAAANVTASGAAAAMNAATKTAASKQ